MNPILCNLTWYQRYHRPTSHSTISFIFFLSHIFTNTISSSSSSTSETLSSPEIPSLSVHHLITLKLNKGNYPLWKAQVIPYLIHQHLFSFVDGSNPCPLHVIATNTQGATTVIINPSFTKWQLQDHLILSAFISALSEKCDHPC